MNQIALGIDPGIANTGYAIVVRTAAKFKVIESGCIQTKAADPTPQRLNEIFKAVSEVVYRHITGIDIIAIESVFYNRNVSSAMRTAGVIGILQLLAEQAQIQSLTVTPQQVKSAVGIAKADKKQVQRLVGKLTGEKVITHHAADAIAAGIAGLLLRGTVSRAQGKLDSENSGAKFA